MARSPIHKTHAAASPPESDHHSRKRVGKACDRCRLKKSKCNGTSPCLRCQQDNAICVFGERKRAHDKQYPKGYVEMLEGQQQQLVTGLQELYQMAVAGSWTGAPLELTATGHPLTHDILDRLGLLRHEGEHDGFEEDFDVMQQRLVASGAAMHSHSDDDDAGSEHYSPPSADSLGSPVPQPQPLQLQQSSSRRRQQQAQLSFSSSSEPDSPPTPTTPIELVQTTSNNMQMADDLAPNFSTIRMPRQTWPQQQPSFATDDMDFLYKSSLGFAQPGLGMDGLFDDSVMLGGLDMQSALAAPMPDMMFDDYFMQS